MAKSTAKTFSGPHVNPNTFFVPGYGPPPAAPAAPKKPKRAKRARGHIVHRAKATGHHYKGHIVFRGSRMEIRF